MIRAVRIGFGLLGLYCYAMALVQGVSYGDLGYALLYAGLYAAFAWLALNRLVWDVI